MAARNQNKVVKEFKYRSLKSIHRKQILEQRRQEIEAEHYALKENSEILESLPPLEDEVEQRRREESIRQTRERLVILEGMHERYNDKLLEVMEEIESESEDK